MQKIFYNKSQLPQIAKQIISFAKCKTLCFYGPMGAGKTTLIKEIVKTLGAEGKASSPTFGLVNEYHDTEGKLLGYHFDCYRLEEETEVLDLGFEDYLNQDVWVFIEWPEKIKSFLPEDKFNVHIAIKDFTTREISF